MKNVWIPNIKIPITDLKRLKNLAPFKPIDILSITGKGNPCFCDGLPINEIKKSRHRLTLFFTLFRMVYTRNGAKHSPPGHQVAPDWLRGGSSSLCSGHPFDPRYVWLNFMKWIDQSFEPHYFWRSFWWFLLEILKFTGTIETRARFGHFLWCWKMKFLEIESRWLKTCPNIIIYVLDEF